MITDNHNIGFPLACMLIHNDYDYDPDDQSISATGLLKSIRRIILSQRHPELSQSVDVSEMAAMATGNGMHAWLEYALQNGGTRKRALELIGHGALHDLMDYCVSIEDAPAKIQAGRIPLLMERRSRLKIGEWEVSGKFDLIIGNTIYDLKTTSAWTYVFAMKEYNLMMQWFEEPMSLEDVINFVGACPKLAAYVLQLSIYRWLNQSLPLKSEGNILFWFTDWSKKNTRSADYPKTRCMEMKVPLLEPGVTGAYLAHKLAALEEAKNLPDDDLPYCTSAELWQDPMKYKYFKNPGNSRATKIYTDFTEADARYKKDGGVGIIETVHAPVKACGYCPVMHSCNQCRELQASGLFTG